MKKLLYPLVLILPFSLSAQTPSIAELQAQIQFLIQQIQALQALKAGGTVSSIPSVSFTQDLTIGSSGSQVSSLQQLLVSKGYMVMPPGVAYGYFGPLTASSVSKFQASNAISPASGYVGPLTRAKLNSLSSSGTH